MGARVNLPPSLLGGPVSQIIHYLCRLYQDPIVILSTFLKMLVKLLNVWTSRLGVDLASTSRRGAGFPWGGA